MLIVSHHANLEYCFMDFTSEIIQNIIFGIIKMKFFAFTARRKDEMHAINHSELLNELDTSHEPLPT